MARLDELYSQQQKLSPVLDDIIKGEGTLSPEIVDEMRTLCEDLEEYKSNSESNSSGHSSDQEVLFSDEEDDIIDTQDQQTSLNPEYLDTLEAFLEEYTSLQSLLELKEKLSNRYKFETDLSQSLTFDQGLKKLEIAVELLRSYYEEACSNSSRPTPTLFKYDFSIAEQAAPIFKFSDEQDLDANPKLKKFCSLVGWTINLANALDHFADLIDFMDEIKTEVVESDEELEPPTTRKRNKSNSLLINSPQHDDTPPYASSYVASSFMPGSPHTYKKSFLSGKPGTPQKILGFSLPTAEVSNPTKSVVGFSAPTEDSNPTRVVGFGAPSKQF